MLKLPTAAHFAELRLQVGVEIPIPSLFKHLFLESYHKYECGNTHIFKRILDNVKKEGGKIRMGSTYNISKLCFRVSFGLVFRKIHITSHRPLQNIQLSGTRRTMTQFLRGSPNLVMTLGTNLSSTVCSTLSLMRTESSKEDSGLS